MKNLILALMVITVLILVLLVVLYIVKHQIANAQHNYPQRDIYIRSLYICVYDMDRAIEFYEKFFEQQVTERDEIYSVFEVYGFRFGLFAFEKKQEEHSFGSNCLPSVSVDNVEVLKEKLEGLFIVFPLTQIGSNWVAEFEDSEGNHIEVTAPVR